MAENDRIAFGRNYTFQFIRLPDRHFTFESTLLEATTEHIILTHTITPSTPLRIGGQEVLGKGYNAVWFLFKDQPFDVARVYRPDGAWTGYYVDVLDPVRWNGADPWTLEPLVDLFLDLWITPAGEYQVLDEDELAMALETGTIAHGQATCAQQVIAKLIQATRAGDFPPDVVRRFTRTPIRQDR